MNNRAFRDFARRAVFFQQFHHRRFVCRSLALCPFIEHVLQRGADLSFDVRPVRLVRESPGFTAGLVRFDVRAFGRGASGQKADP